jgi:hypothetical protein
MLPILSEHDRVVGGESWQIKGNASYTFLSFLNHLEIKVRHAPPPDTANTCRIGQSIQYTQIEIFEDMPVTAHCPKSRVPFAASAGG